MKIIYNLYKFQLNRRVVPVLLVVLFRKTRVDQNTGSALLIFRPGQLLGCSVI